MLPVWLLGAILIVNIICNWTMAQKFVLINISWSIFSWKISTGDLGGMTSRALKILRFYSFSNVIYIDDIDFFEVNAKYISSNVIKISANSRVHSTSEISDIFNTWDEILLVFTEKVTFLLFFLSRTVHCMPFSSRIISQINLQICYHRKYGITTWLLNTLPECYLGDITYTSILVWGQIRENVLKNEYAKHVGYKQFVIFHQN